ncbi:MarR family winged helix-turn-helix transcriptional regulator [Hephaestia mangrovi]|uniref:MarR family winged helix-turn-helix transcriptional regulator n=1 Tax=Hephaestia mangrovi TaxID=2873268 RepID=UPI001CA77C4E|nr:MarR family winged helix-turn-helix transcriptional regulator [Hephaestia mangrovi]MBY8827599.1 MarR family winged helix-turn-helix transcriptional regulator [Hephaestia mangrovi]
MADTLKLDDFLPYRLSIASNRVSGAIATAYHALFGLRIPEWRLVAVLAEGGEMTQRAIGHVTQMDKVTVSRAAIVLVERGLAARSPNEDDQRSHHLSLTKAGRRLYDEVAPMALAIDHQIFEGFSRDELATLRAMLERLEKAATALEVDQG